MDFYGSKESEILQSIPKVIMPITVFRIIFGKIKVSLRGESSLDFLKNDVINLRVQLFPLNSALLPGG